MRYPAAEKRQGTKSREVGRWLSRGGYEDLMLAQSSMIQVRLTGLELCVADGRSAECGRRFGECSERIGA